MSTLVYEKDLVSIIMPAFNSEKYIGDAIESVLGQTYKKFELIVINDGSLDHTESKIKKYSDTLQYISQPNQGAASARNNGILAARGEYISFLDSDDLWFENTLKLQHEYLASHPSVGLVYGEIQLFDHTGVLDENWMITTGLPRPEGFIFQELVFQCLFGLSTVMVRRQILDNVGLFNSNLPSGEDYDLWLRISAMYKIGYIPERLMRYRQHADSLTASNSSLKPWDISVAEKALEMHPVEAKKISSFQLKKEFAKRYFQGGYSAFTEGKYAIARYRFFKSVSLMPLKSRAIFYLIASCCFPRLIHSVIRMIK